MPADSSALVRIQLSSSVRPGRSAGGASDDVGAGTGVGVGVGVGGALLVDGTDDGFDGGALESYRRPRHHISSSLALVGRGS